MPSRDSNGKRLSGAAQLLKRGERLPPLKPTALAAFEAIGPPDLDDPGALLSWGRSVLAAPTWLVGTGQLDGQHHRLVWESVRGLGASHNRGMVEHEVREIQKRFDDVTQAPSAMLIEPGNAVPIP